VDLGAMGIRTSLPVLDRHSTLSYDIAQHVHRDLAVHRGADISNISNISNISIISNISNISNM
jgi:hypothetical protein